ncbi:MAG: hypothetical protein AB7C90_05095 [Bacteroidales bacterium]
MDYSVLSPSKTTWDDYMKQNEIVKNWATSTREKVKGSAAQLVRGKKGTVQRRSKSGTVRDEEKLKVSIRHRVYYRHGISEGVGFRMERHGVFVHKGVGNGYKMVNGMVVRYAKGPVGPNGPRIPKDWFNIVIEQTAPVLANQIAQVNTEAAVNATRMRIN